MISGEHPHLEAFLVAAEEHVAANINATTAAVGIHTSANDAGNTAESERNKSAIKSKEVLAILESKYRLAVSELQNQASILQSQRQEMLSQNESAALIDEITRLRTSIAKKSSAIETYRSFATAHHASLSHFYSNQLIPLFDRTYRLDQASPKLNSETSNNTNNTQQGYRLPESINTPALPEGATIDSLLSSTRETWDGWKGQDETKWRRIQEARRRQNAIPSKEGVESEQPDSMMMQVDNSMQGAQAIDAGNNGVGQQKSGVAVNGVHSLNVPSESLDEQQQQRGVRQSSVGENVLAMAQEREPSPEPQGLGSDFFF